MEFTLQRTLTIRTSSEHAAGVDARRYWRTRSPSERLAAIEFLIVGAYALALHGVPRFTGDIDVFIRPTSNRILQMGVEPVQIHVMSDVSGVTWDEAWEGRTLGTCGTHELPFIGRLEFIRNTRAAGRLEDLADVEALGADDPPVG